MILLVSMNLRPVRPILGLLTVMADRSDAHWLMMPGVWLVDTTLNAAAFHAAIAPFLTPHDGLLIIRVTPDYSGQLTKEGWRWITEARDGKDFDAGG